MGKLSGSVVKWEAKGLQSELVPPKQWLFDEFQSTLVNVPQPHFFVLVFRGCDAGFQNGSDWESEAAKPVNIGLVQARHYQRLGPFCQPMKRLSLEGDCCFLDGRRSTLHSQLK